MDSTELNTMLTGEVDEGFPSAQYLQDVEILGDSRHVKRIRKLFEHSSVKIKVVQERASLKASYQWDEDTANTITEISIDDDVDEACRTLSRASISILQHYVSSDENSSGLDTEDEYRNSSSDGSASSSRSSTPSVSPEIRNRRNMILVQSRIKNLKEKTLITPTRLFLKEATFIKHKSHYFTFFLFDDLLVITKTKAENCGNTGSTRQVKFYKALDLRYLTIEMLPDSQSKGNNLLKFHYEKSRTKKWRRVFASPSKEQQITWFADLRRLRDQLVFGANFAILTKSSVF